MKKFLKKYKEIINYLIFGLLTTVVNLLVKYLLLFTIFDANNPILLQCAIIVSWIVAVLFAYFTNRKFVFKSINKSKLKEFVSFIVSRLSTLFLEMIIMWFFVTLLKFNSNLSVIIITAISQITVIICNYVFSKFFVFTK